MSAATAVHFGGPDGPARRLRNLLAERIAAVPAGGSIDWVTYYFRDRGLADELLRARRRGVEVRVLLEARPRSSEANAAVIARLSGRDGLGDGLRSVAHLGVPLPGRRRWRPHLHEKLYCFSHPRPVALLGTFNPSGDEPEQCPAILDEIGDQDRGYNFLAELVEPEIARGLAAHARRLFASSHGLAERFAAAANRPLASAASPDLAVHFWPRVRSNPVAALLASCGPGARARVAASHVKGPGTAAAFVTAAARGAEVWLLADATHRRVPPRIERRLQQSGVVVRRVRHPAGVPMHDKFALVETPERRCVAFGSLNWTTRSLYLNHELAVVTSEPALCDTFAERFDALARHAGSDEEGPWPRAAA